jgi:hypothetical protein
VLLEDLPRFVVPTIGLHGYQGAAAPKLFVVVARVLLRNAHSGERTDDSARRGAGGGATQHSCQSTARYYWTDARNKSGCHCSQYAANDASGQRARRCATPGIACLIARPDCSFTVAAIFCSKSNLVIAKAVPLKRINRSLRVIPLVKHTHHD